MRGLLFISMIIIIVSLACEVTIEDGNSWGWGKVSLEEVDSIVYNIENPDEFTIIVSNVSGNIDINRTEGSEIRIFMKKKGYGEDKKEARKNLKKIGVRKTIDKNSITVEAKPKKMGQVYFLIDLPLDLEEVEINTVSGDIKGAGVSVNEFKSSLVSGDIKLRGDITKLKLKSVSGDIDVKGQIDLAILNTVSGDIKAEFTSLQRGGEVSTTSGDIELTLEGKINLRLEIETLSGEIETRGVTPLYSKGKKFTGEIGKPEYTIKIHTLSGDIDINRF